MIKKLICYLIGCNSICLFRYHWSGNNDMPGYCGQSSETTHWECQRCGKQRHEQWDA